MYFIQKYFLHEYTKVQICLTWGLYLGVVVRVDTNLLLLEVEGVCAMVKSTQLVM